MVGTSTILIIIVNTHLCVCCSHKCILLEYFYEGNLCCQQSKSHSNTAARPKTKGYVTELGSLGSLLRCKSRLQMCYILKNNG